MGKPDLSNYIEVSERIRIFAEKYPEGSIQTHIITLPPAFADKFIACEAKAYRTPDDPKPGIDVAWEPVPGKTPYTKDSELMNASTSAVGRAIVAVLAADTQHGVASADEVRNRRPSGAGGTATGFTSPAPVPASQRPAELEGTAGEVKGGGSVSSGEASDPSPYDRDGLWADLHTLYGTTPKIIGHINSATGKRYKPSDEADITTEELELTVAAAKEGAA